MASARHRVGKLWSRLTRDGPLTVLRQLCALIADRWSEWRDGALDREYGTDTAGVIEAEALPALGQHGAHSCGHEPVRIVDFQRILRDLALDAARFTFVDVGSGKARAVLLAAQYPFRRVIGIEFSPALHAFATRNVSLFAARATDAAPIELRCEDALESELPAGDMVLFLYNPFDGVVMEQFLRRLGQWYGAASRQLVLIYRNPRCASLLEQAAFLRRIRANRTYHVYQGVAPPATMPRARGVG
jgi:SAM-dependent methyltransferase